MTDDRVDRRARFDHDHGLARTFERADEFLHRFRGLNAFSFGAAGGEFLGDVNGAIENGDGKSFRRHVQDEVFAHHSQADEANITLIRAHFRSPLLARHTSRRLHCNE